MILFLLACTENKEKHPLSDTHPIWTEYDAQEPGPFHVGHIQITHSYRPIEGADPREIIIDIWYPSEEDDGEPAQYLYGIDPLAFEEASIGESIHEGGYPIHLHSHGYRGWGATSSNLMIHFASHGWISIAPNHSENLLSDHESPLPVAHYIHRPLDLQESLNVLGGLEMFDSIQQNNVLMSGHSFGAGYSTWGIAGATYAEASNFCNTGAGLEDESLRCTETERELFLSGALVDSRITALVPMAGTIRSTFFGDTGHESVEKTHSLSFWNRRQPRIGTKSFSEYERTGFSMAELGGRMPSNLRSWSMRHTGARTWIHYRLSLCTCFWTSTNSKRRKLCPRSMAGRE